MYHVEGVSSIYMNNHYIYNLENMNHFTYWLLVWLAKHSYKRLKTVLSLQ